MTGLLVNRGKQTHGQLEHPVSMKAEVRVMHLQTEECQRLPASQQKLGERLETDPASLPRGNQPCRHFDLGLLNSETVTQ